MELANGANVVDRRAARLNSDQVSQDDGGTKPPPRRCPWLAHPWDEKGKHRLRKIKAYQLPHHGLSANANPTSLSAEDDNRQCNGAR
jgi:hypothetical protein